MALTKIQAESQAKISNLQDKIALEKVKQEIQKLAGEVHNTRKQTTVAKRLGLQAKIEEIKYKGDLELEKQATLSLQKLESQTAIASNDLAISQQNLGASDVRVNLNHELIRAQLTIESVKLAETQTEAKQLLEIYREKYGETPKLSQSKVSPVRAKTA